MSVSLNKTKRGVNIQQPIFGIAVLVILYLVGVLGFTSAYREQFILLTPVNLLTSMMIILYYHQHWSKNFIGVLLFCYFTGFILEYIGVETGLLFGEYSYGRTLGPKLHGTPFAIGLNWAMLVYCTSSLLNKIIEKSHFLIKAFVGASIMVALDFLIEPVAIANDFWTWAGADIPIQNYIAWWVISFVLIAIFVYSFPKTINKVAIALLFIQFSFFGILGLLT